MGFEKSRYIQVIALIVIIVLTFAAWFRSPNLAHRCTDEPTAEISQPGTDCPVDSILCGVKDLEETHNSPDINKLRMEFHKLVTTIDFHCPTLIRFGKDGGGGYPACMTKATRPDYNSCLIYSFGIFNDWSFDEAWAKYGCEVHSFDPSIGKQDHMHAPNVSFHNLGLWGSDYTNRYGWRLERLSTIKKRLGHQERIIDALKIDVERAEWPFLRDIIYSDPTGLSNVRQLFIELHTPKKRGCSNMQTADFAEINDYVRRLRIDLDFLLYKNVQHNNCCGGYSDLMPAGVYERCCYEVFFVNSRLLAT